jgi:hypothetical protein
VSIRGPSFLHFPDRSNLLVKRLGQLWESHWSLSSPKDRSSSLVAAALYILLLHAPNCVRASVFLLPPLSGSFSPTSKRHWVSHGVSIIISPHPRMDLLSGCRRLLYIFKATSHLHQTVSGRVVASFLHFSRSFNLLVVKRLGQPKRSSMFPTCPPQ